MQRRLMVMAMQHQLGAVLVQHFAQGLGVGQAAEKVRARGRRVMDQHDTKQLLASELRQQLAELFKLVAVQSPGRGERQGRQRSRKADQRQRAALSHVRKSLAVVAAHEVGEVLLGKARRGLHIGIVVAGHGADVVRIAQRIEPGARRRELVGERQVDEVAGDRDVVGRLAL